MPIEQLEPNHSFVFFVFKTATQPLIGLNVYCEKRTFKKNKNLKRVLIIHDASSKQVGRISTSFSALRTDI